MTKKFAIRKVEDNFTSGNVIQNNYVAIFVRSQTQKWQLVGINNHVMMVDIGERND
jgi:hypothetical protein